MRESTRLLTLVLLALTGLAPSTQCGSRPVESPAAASGSALADPANAPPAAAVGLTQTFRGLFLRTHPDNDKAASKVFLVHADEIVLDDGTRATDWNGLTADITVAGENGLDTGSEAPATWYEIYAIRKSTDGKKSLLFHRAKNYHRDQTQANVAGEEPLRDTSDRTKLAQGIQLATAGPVEFVDVSVLKRGSPKGNVWFTLESDSSGSPSGTALATSDKLDGSKLAPLSTFVRFIFRSPATLAVGTPYHLVFNADFPIDANNAVAWSGDASNSYPSGSARQCSGSVWMPTAKMQDFSFRLHVTREEVTVTMPAGYDQKAKIGYVYNDSTGDFSGFVAMGRQVMPLTGQGVSAFENTLPVLFDLSRSIPPGPIRMELAGSNEAPGSRIIAQPVPMGFDAASSPAPFTRSQGGQASAVAVVGSGEPTVVLGSVFTEFQGCYFSTTGRLARSTISLWEW